MRWCLGGRLGAVTLLAVFVALTVWIGVANAEHGGAHGVIRQHGANNRALIRQGGRQAGGDDSRKAEFGRSRKRESGMSGKASSGSCRFTINGSTLKVSYSESEGGNREWTVDSSDDHGNIVTATCSGGGADGRKNRAVIRQSGRRNVASVRQSGSAGDGQTNSCEILLNDTTISITESSDAKGGFTWTVTAKNGDEKVVKTVCSRTR